MNTLPENLINKIMLYVSHPCADIMRTCLCDRFDDVLLLKTERRCIPILNCYTRSWFEVRDNTSKGIEYSWEYNVIQNHIYNKLKVLAISETDVLRLCPEYVHFNKSIINEILIEDEESMENDDDYNY